MTIYKKEVKKIIEIPLDEEDLRRITETYIDKIIGQDCYITEDNDLEHWTSWPHGSGTTTKFGKATELQIAANNFKKALRNILNKC